MTGRENGWVLQFLETPVANPVARSKNFHRWLARPRWASSPAGQAAVIALIRCSYRAQSLYLGVGESDLDVGARAWCEAQTVVWEPDLGVARLQL